MNPTLDKVLERASLGPVARQEAFRLASDGIDLLSLMHAAQQRRDRRWGNVLTFSPKVFLPVTNLCRNRCDYCSFRRSPGDAGEWTMSPSEVTQWLKRGREQGCIEALLCLGDTPETGFGDYRALLKGWGFETTADYLYWIGQEALSMGLLPHTNAGILTRAQMHKLKEVNVSLGLMLENVSERLCQKGMPHYKAPDKRPTKRLQMTKEAGELKVPFTSGVLIGIGETMDERVETLLAIEAMHREYGHIQEVIVQNFRARPQIVMADAPEPADLDVARTVALARLILDDNISIQAPPNLNPASIPLLIDAGINDFGGVSPVTKDYINPIHPWPQLDSLDKACNVAGFTLCPRLPIYDSYPDRPGFVDSALIPSITMLQSAMAHLPSVSDLPNVQRPGINVPEVV